MPKQTEKLGDWRVLKTAEAVAVHAAEWLCSDVADAMDPQPPDEPEIFRNGK